MMIIGDDELSIGGNSTINELIVVIVCLYKVKMIVWRYELNEVAVSDCFDNILCHFRACKTLKNLQILFKYFV